MSKFHEVCQQYHGQPLKKREAYRFTPGDGRQAITALGFDVAIPVPDRLITLAWLANGKVVVEFPKQGTETFPWVEESRKWYLVAGELPRKAEHLVDIADLDNLIRCLMLPNLDPAGWAAIKETGDWMRKFASSIKTMLQAMGHAKPEAEIIMGHLESNPWELVCLPMHPEYPGDRKWNLNAPRLRCEPVEGSTPTWDLIEAHLMQEAVMPDALQAVGIKTGGQYLRAWLAVIVRDPLLRLPYMFFWGEENVGKSTWWEAIDNYIIDGGIVKADRALTSKNDFNGELLNCILGVIEEKDITSANGSLAKIKDAVTGLTLSIRAMRRDSFQAPNYTHWLHLANSIASVHLYHGATRFNCFHVGPLEHEIAKPDLFAQLAAEAPAYTYQLLNMPLPKAAGRFSLPTIETPSFQQACNFGAADWIVELADWLDEHGSFSGTLRELREHVDSVPRDMRPCERGLSNHKLYLAGRKITFLIGDKGERGKTLTLKRAA